GDEFSRTVCKESKQPRRLILKLNASACPAEFSGVKIQFKGFKAYSMLQHGSGIVLITHEFSIFQQKLPSRYPPVIPRALSAGLREGRLAHIVSVKFGGRDGRERIAVDEPDVFRPGCCQRGLPMGECRGHRAVTAGGGTLQGRL